MALFTFLPESSEAAKKQHRPSSKRKRKQPSSWDQIKNILTCKQIEGSRVHDPSKSYGGYSKLGSSCSSIRDVVHGKTASSRVVHRADNSPESSSLGQDAGLLTRKNAGGSSSGRSLSASSSTRSNGGAIFTSSSSFSSRGMPLRKLSGCYECHMIVDPSSRIPSSRSSINACSDCGEVFPKMESLEIHQAVRHAVSELGPEDSGRNIVEIIFKSSWMKKDNSICKIERILKVHNTQRTIQRFEDYRDNVKARASGNTKKNPARCAADGNELLRFHCATVSCTLGARGSASLCAAVPGCGVCTIIRHGFQGKAVTTASSGRAHDCLVGAAEGRRAMLVCRVIAGRVRCVADDAAPEEDWAQGGSGSGSGSYDSVARNVGPYSNMEELWVFNPRAVLPCFVVIYKAGQLPL
ncbi:uncharacterized protein LOC131161408 [Malania oleifera]|uniref:uncharacterized protein LOC131161408 n=1 Tax=Malania oleifera TaxID=397392 RepID=UPI0025AE55AC|nr:uncharacterized protein LOC131161408 [Malania oleifera]